MLDHVKKLSLQKKIFALCMSISLVPLCVLGILCTNRTKDALISREKIVLTDTLKQENLVLESKLNGYEDAMNYICLNESLITAMNGRYESNYEMYLLYRDTVQPLLSTAKALYTDINDVVIYTDLDVFSKNNILQPISSIEHYPWYDQIFQTKNSNLFVFTSEKERSLSYVCRVYGVERNTVIVKMDIDYDSFFSAFRTLYENYYRLLITDKNDKVIYQYATSDMEGYIEEDELLEEVIINNYTNWRISIARPNHAVYAPITSFKILFFVITSVCLLVVLFLSWSMSQSIVQPLQELQQNMKRIENGDYHALIEVKNDDEIGQLTKDFNHMTKQIEFLISQVYLVKIQQKEQELLALQSQINPHFLHNSLSLINSKAILCNQPEIANMAQYLSTFYRTSLNNGKNIITVKEEVDNIRSYINIQLAMHSQGFCVEYDFDEKIYQYKMQKLLLQPLVENAILHGLDNTRGRKKVLLVSGVLSGNTIVFQIVDNGAGIRQKDLEDILTRDTKGYGVKNIHNRIQILYGSQYGLSYHSVVNEGTVVTVTIPCTLE